MQAHIKKHGPGHAHHGVKFGWKREGRKVTLAFQVQKRNSREWRSDSAFSLDWSKNWGLWNHDVVEAFLQLRSSDDEIKAPYLEIQVSPLNQPFALVIVEPRKTFHPPKTLNFTSEVTCEGKLWTGTMEVELPEEIQGHKLYGGLFACLDEGPREYYALEPNPEAAPDFHRPELFLPLDEE